VFHDISGNRRVGRLTAGSASTGVLAGNGAGIPVAYVGGTPSTKILWGDLSVPSTFTICSITRYSGAAKARILTTSTNANWLHGHWGVEGAPHEKAGATYYVTDVKIGHTITPNTDWVVACGRNVAVGSGKVGTIINGETTHKFTLPELRTMFLENSETKQKMYDMLITKMTEKYNFQKVGEDVAEEIIVEADSELDD
jgi:hypothetical protein